MNSKWISKSLIKQKKKNKHKGELDWASQVGKENQLRIMQEIEI